MRIVILTVLVATCAMGMNFDLGNLAGMLGGLGNMGGLMQEMGNIDMDQVGEMLEHINPQELMKNIPPEILNMVEGMGISKADLTEAASMLPDHMDEIKGMLGSMKKGDMQKLVQEQISGSLGGFTMPDSKQVDEIIEQLTTYAKEQLAEFGLDLEDIKDVKSAMPKLVEYLKTYLKEQGVDVDTEDPEALQQEIRKELKNHFNIKDGASDAEMKEAIMKQMREYMDQNGIDISDEEMRNPMLAVGKMKKQFFTLAKDYGVDLDEYADSSFGDIKKLVMSKLQDSGILENPMQYLPTIMQAFNSFTDAFNKGIEGMPPPQIMMPQQQMMMHQQQMMMPQQQMMMQPMGMPMHMNLEINLADQQRALSRPPMAFPAYLRGAEDALVHAFGDDQEVVRNVMAVQAGLAHGAVDENAVHELLSDLMHFRLQARVLASRNQMLENQVLHQEFESRIPVTRSPFLNHIRHKCRHKRNY